MWVNVCVRESELSRMCIWGIPRLCAVPLLYTLPEAECVQRRNESRVD